MMACSHEMLHIVPVYGSGYRLNTKDDGMWHFTLCFNAQLNGQVGKSGPKDRKNLLQPLFDHNWAC